MILLKELTIEAFRGVRSRLKLDLSSPITLIYAPNGVGKTSICDAAEWLLTGNVKRLESGGSSQDELRCIFSQEDIETKVSGSLEVDGESLTLQKTLNGFSWELSNHPLRAVTITDVLGKLAPGGAEPGAHHSHANNSRQISIRGTRFLSGDSLAALLDSDQNSIGNRERVFADLLGVGHLLETERQLEAYLSTLSPYLRKQQALVEDRLGSLRERQSQIDLEQDVTEQSLIPDAVAKLLEACGLIQFSSEGLVPLDTKPADLRKALLLVRGELERRRSSLSERRQAEIRLAVDWSSRHLIEQQLVSDQARSSALSESIATNVAQADTLNQRIFEMRQQAASVQQRMSQIAERGQRLLAAIAFAQPLLTQYLQLSKLDKLEAGDALKLVDSAGSETARASTANRLRAVRDELPIRQREDEELTTLQDQRTGLLPLLLSGEAQQKTQKEAKEVAARVAALRATYEAAAGPVSQLQSLASKLVDLLEHEKECPVCGHDWATVEQLRAAIAAASSTTPASLQEMANSLGKAEDESLKLQNLLNLQRTSLQAIDALDKRIRAIESTKGGFSARLAELGLAESADDLPQKIDVAIGRLSLVDGLKRVLEELKLCETILGRTGPRNVSVQELVSLIKSALDSLSSALGGVLVEGENAQKPIAKELEQLIRDRGSFVQEEATTKKRIENSALRLQALRSAWQQLADAREWTEEALAEVSNSLRIEQDNFLKSEQLIHQAERLAETSATREEVKRLQSELAPIEAEAARLQRYHVAANSVLLAYRQTRLQHARKQMEDFVKVISALFTRMQANEVYDKITEGDEKAPLSWRAISAGLSVDPDMKFSQGQKQDFALSIFLSRARGLGGTFFLDEPLAHLDDLNRVALLDVFRAICLERNRRLSIVLTTASMPVLRHIVEKFAQVGVSSKSQDNGSERVPILRVLNLEGNPRTDVRLASLN
jgi:DNA repair protein SbcC/Rad50